MVPELINSLDSDSKKDGKNFECTACSYINNCDAVNCAMCGTIRKDLAHRTYVKPKRKLPVVTGSGGEYDAGWDVEGVDAGDAVGEGVEGWVEVLYGGVRSGKVFCRE